MKQLRKSIAPKWYPFLKLLLKNGSYQWKTPDEKEVTPLIVSTLYLDGDIHCIILDPQGYIPETLTPQTADTHLEKMTADLASLQKFATNIAYFIGVFILSGVWAFNFEEYLKSLIFTSIFIPSAYYLRKAAIPLIIKLIFKFLKLRFEVFQKS